MNHNKLKKILYILLAVLLLLGTYLIISFEPGENNISNNNGAQINDGEEGSISDNNETEEGGVISFDKTEKYLELEEKGEDLTMVRRDQAMRESQDADTEISPDGANQNTTEEAVIPEYGAPEGRVNPMPFPNLEGRGLHFMNEQDKENFNLKADAHFQILSWNEDGSINAYKPVSRLEDIVYPE